MTSAQATETIRRYIVDELLSGDARDFSDETDLLETGILDSFSALALINFLEEAFDCQLALDQVEADNLRNVNAVNRLVEGTLARIGA